MSMMSMFKSTTKSLMILLIPLACDVEDTSTSRNVADASALLVAEEDARLAMEALVECDTVSSVDCNTEEEVLLEALLQVDELKGEHDFRASCYASCLYGTGVTCGGTYACGAWDGWGCASYVLFDGVPTPFYNLCPDPCGNGSCDPGENHWSCPSDCDPCGNGSCDPGESQWSCPEDCPACPPWSIECPAVPL